MGLNLILFFYLVKDDGHDVEVQEEALGGTRTVEVEKNERKEESQELEAGITEGRTQEFQPSNCCQENVTAGNGTNVSTDNK